MFWDVFGEQGHPVRTTASEVGPLLLARMLDLNDIQEAVLTVAFRVADDNGLLLLDLDDLRAILKFVADNAAEIGTTYGNVSRGLRRRHPARAAHARGAGRATASSASPPSTSSTSCRPTPRAAATSTSSPPTSS